MRPAIFVAIPAYSGRLEATLVSSLLHSQLECHQHDIGFGVAIFCGQALLVQARNRLVAQFLAQPEFTHCLFIDSDIGFEPNTISKLLAHDVDFVGVPVRFRDGSVKWNIIPESMELVNGLLLAKQVGGGIVLHKRTVFEQLRDQEHVDDWNVDLDAPNLKVRPIYATMTINNTFIGEDTVLCRKWQALGGKCWIDPSIATSHTGSQTFSGRLSDILAGDK